MHKHRAKGKKKMSGKTLKFYSHDSCGGCKELLPIVKKYAKKNGVKLKVIDVESCRSKKCDGLRYVPYLEYGNREIKTSKELAEVLGVAETKI